MHIPNGAIVVDMTAEFPVHPALRTPSSLVLLPTLDARSPGPLCLLQFARQLQNAGRPIYLHCAQGHGRSATLAAVLMVLREDAPTDDEAMRQMQRFRPAVHLHSVQRRDAIEAVHMATAS